MSIRNIECLRQFSRTGTEPAFVVDFTPPLHQLDSAKRLGRSNQNKAVARAFHQHVQHPVRAVTEINVGCARFVSLDECASAWTRKSMAGLVILSQVRFGFHDSSRASAPD